jgi:hypothetical protein
LEKARAEGDDQLVALLKDETGKSPAAIKKALAATPNPDRVAKLLAVCDNDPELRDRVLPFLGLVRDDLRDNPRVYLPGALYVTTAGDRRASGTYYTPRSLAEEVVEHALDPVAYSPGPAEEPDPEKWKLKSPDELLDLNVADVAMGSGAFLVAACRYLAARLLAAWGREETPTAPSSTAIVKASGDSLPSDPYEREVLAHRLVAERCLYGIDKNPMAVEMAKLSLWLVTLAKDRPFSFLDHSLREGDSLLGAVSMDQVRCFHMDPSRGRALHENLLGHTSSVGPAVERALALRAELESFVVRDIRDAGRKHDLYGAATAALDDTRLLADVVVGAAIAHGHGEELDSALISVEALVPALLGQEVGAAARTQAREALGDASQRWLQNRRPDPSVDRRCFHWALELPEVRARGGFDAIVGNPPFLGNKYWKDAVGPFLQNLARHLLSATPGKIDLAVLFHRRAYALLAPGGCYGLLGSTQSAEGQAVSVGLGAISNTGTVFRAVRGMAWPGDAKVRVNLVWVKRGQYAGTIVLDGTEVDRIVSTLSSGAEQQAPRKLSRPDLWAFEGVHNAKGAAFVLQSHDPWFSRLSAEGSGMLRPYISGEDLGARPMGVAARWVVDTGDEDLETLRHRYPIAYAFLVEQVQATRTPEVLKPYKGLERRWWQFWNTRAALYRRLRARQSCVVLPKVAMYVLPARAPTHWCFTNKVIVIEEAREDTLGVLRSAPFCEWVSEYSTSFGVGSGISPSISRGINTFMMPPTSRAVHDLGEQWHVESNKWCEAAGKGLTAMQNAMHHDDGDADVFRSLQCKLDAAVVKAYGWTDVDLIHDFHETPQGVRFGVGGTAREVIIDRLRALNLSVAAEKPGALGGPGTTSGYHRATRASAEQATMFGDD